MAIGTVVLTVMIHKMVIGTVILTVMEYQMAPGTVVLTVMIYQMAIYRGKKSKSVFNFLTY